MADAILTRLSASDIFDLRGTVAVVTGGGSGIGLMITTTLMANGATVYIIGPKQDELDKIAKVYNDAGAQHENADRMGKIYGLEGDISVKEEALRLAEELKKREGHVTVLFNNAGILVGKFNQPTASTADAFVKAYFDPVTPTDFTRSLQTNAVGPYWLTFAFLPLLEKWKANGSLGEKFVPQVIMTSSMNGWTKDPVTSGGSFPYMYSKSAIGHATATLAHELLPLGVRVNGIAPGLFITEMSAPGNLDSLGRSHNQNPKAFNWETPTQPGVPTGGTNRDVGSLALMLIVNWFINGETVLIDGGTLLKHPSSY